MSRTHHPRQKSIRGKSLRHLETYRKGEAKHPSLMTLDELYHVYGPDVTVDRIRSEWERSCKQQRLTQLGKKIEAGDDE